MIGATSVLPSAARDLVGRVLHDELVLAVHHVRALLLGARGADDDRRRAGGDQVAHLGPGQVFEKDRIRRFAAGPVFGASAGRCAESEANGSSRSDVRITSFFIRELGDILRA